MTTTRFNYADLDPGIRQAVMLLRAEGFDTTDSGDGRTKPPGPDVLTRPHVFALTTKSKLIAEADRMLALLQSMDTGVTGWIVEGSYSASDGRCVLAALGAPLDPVKR